MPQGVGYEGLKERMQDKDDTKLLQTRLENLRKQRAHTQSRAGSSKEAKARAKALESKIREHEHALIGRDPDKGRYQRAAVSGGLDPKASAQSNMRERMKRLREIEAEAGR